MPTCQGQHPDGSPCRNPAPEGQTHCYIHRRPEPDARLTREDVLSAIEEHGGPQGLDLSHEEIMRIDLSRAAIHEELMRRNLTQAPWCCPDTKGIDLRRAQLWLTNLRDANLSSANLMEADLTGANLMGVDFSGANFKSAVLGGAQLQEACLARSNLQAAKLEDANFCGADFEGARLAMVDLTVVEDITRVRWSGVILSRTRLRPDQIGNKIADEIAAEQGEHPFDVARETYLTLKTNFNELGRYDDASWAYRKERRTERAMSSWRRAMKEYREEWIRLEHEHLREVQPWDGFVAHALEAWKARFLMASFYGKHGAKWLADGTVEVVTDYGESPGRVLGWAALLLLVLYPFVYWWCAGRPDPVGNPLVFWKEYFLLSLGSFSTLDIVNLNTASGWTRLWAASEAMVGISLLALLMFTLGNRISRS